jgi:hypothetical protein
LPASPYWNAEWKALGEGNAATYMAAFIAAATY